MGREWNIKKRREEDTRICLRLAVAKFKSSVLKLLSNSAASKITK